MAMFRLNEEKLRAAFAATGDAQESAHYRWIEPFDPMSIDADDLHRIVDDCLQLDIIEKADPSASIAVYPLAISDSQPLISVNPGRGPMLLGGEALRHVTEEVASTLEDRSVIALRVMVDDANTLYGEFKIAKVQAKDRNSEAVRRASSEDPRPCD
jgi:hypothetical protein